MSKHLGTHKDTEKLARKARKQGWTVEITSNNHLRWTAPDGQIYLSGLTSSSGGRRKLMSNLRKAGLQ